MEREFKIKADGDNRFEIYTSCPKGNGYIGGTLPYMNILVGIEVAFKTEDGIWLFNGATTTRISLAAWHDMAEATGNDLGRMYLAQANSAEIEKECEADDLVQLQAKLDEAIGGDTGTDADFGIKGDGNNDAQCKI